MICMPSRLGLEPSFSQRVTASANRWSSSQPPKPHDFKPNLARTGEALDTSAATATAAHSEPKDPARGMEAAKRVVTTGKLDARYKGAARRYTAIICATPIAIYLSYVLYGRLFLGVERKEISLAKSDEAKHER